MSNAVRIGTRGRVWQRTIPDLHENLTMRSERVARTAHGLAVVDSVSRWALAPVSRAEQPGLRRSTTSILNVCNGILVVERVRLH